MPNQTTQTGKNVAEQEEATLPIPRRAINWVRWVWRPAASIVAAALALQIGWFAFSGKNGLSAWMEKRTEERQLHKQIDDLQQENARLRNRIDQLKTNPDAVGIVARDKLHYVGPNEVIISLPPDQKTATPPAAGGSK
jgi:cell division protein FtsB